MLDDRGFDIISKKTHDTHLSIESSDTNEEDNSFMYAESRLIKGRIIIVIFDFVMGSKIKKETLQICVKLIEKYNYSRIILVYNDSTTSAAETLISSLADQGKIIEVKKVCDLTFNPTKHRLQPKFERISLHEKKNICNLLGPSKNFGIMLTSDPIAKWYDYNPDDFIKITRKNGEIYYRRVRK